VYPHQTERLTQVLEHDDLAALVATTPANVFYVCGHRSRSRAVDPTTRRFAVLTRRGTALVVPAIDARALADEPADADHVVCYGPSVSEVGERPDERSRRVAAWLREPSADPAEGLARALDALGVGRGRVGLDADGAREATHRRLAERLPTLSLVDGTAALARARAVKGPWELECLARALGIAEEAVNEVLQMLKPGVGEREAAALYDAEVAERGAEPSETRIVMGERSALPAASPSARALRPGDLVRLEVGCVFRGYCSAVARTAVMGEPTALQEARHTAILAGGEAAIDAISHGVAVGAVFDAAIRAASETGLRGYRRDHVGHGIGLDAVEPPRLAPGGPATLEAGMVLRVEMPYFEKGWGGLTVTDTVLVRPKDGHILNRSERGLIVLD
jgi:Xaa-Pro aminopeptidase